MLYSVDTGWKPMEEFQIIFRPLHLLLQQSWSPNYELDPLTERTVNLASE